MESHATRRFSRERLGTRGSVTRELETAGVMVLLV
jgi:hypothetical protein